MTIYVSNGTLFDFDSGSASNVLAVVNGSLVLFVTQGITKAVDAGRFNAESNVKCTKYVQTLGVNAGRFSQSAGIKPEVSFSCTRTISIDAGRFQVNSVINPATTYFYTKTTTIATGRFCVSSGIDPDASFVLGVFGVYPVGRFSITPELKATSVCNQFPAGSFSLDTGFGTDISFAYSKNRYFNAGRFSLLSDLTASIKRHIDCGRFSVYSVIDGKAAFPFSFYCMNLSGLGFDHFRHVGFSIGNCACRLMDCGLGIDLFYKLLLQVGTFLVKSTAFRNMLSRGDHTLAAQMVLSVLPDDFRLQSKMVNELAGMLRLIQQQSNSLSSDPVTVLCQYMQSLSAANDIRATQKLAVSISDPEAQFKTVPAGIYIDGRPI